MSGEPTRDHGSEPQLSGDILVIIPTYNEKPNIARLIGEILELQPSCSILVVDDSSPDGTGEIVDSIAAREPARVSILHRPRKEGIGQAYIAGFQRALASNAQRFVTMDADFSHDPADVPRLVEASEQADLVLGSRYVPGGSTEGWPAHRRLLSRLGGLYARLVLGVPIADLTGGFKVYNRRALETLDLDKLRSDGYVFQIETTYRIWQAGLKVREVPIRFVDRVAGKSKLSRRIVLEAVIVVWRLRFQRLFG
jgi:dolichol-phosphate mannosyltransferase